MKISSLYMPFIFICLLGQVYSQEKKPADSFKVTKEKKTVLASDSSLKLSISTSKSDAKDTASAKSSSKPDSLKQTQKNSSSKSSKSVKAASGNTLTLKSLTRKLRYRYKEAEPSIAGTLPILFIEAKTRLEEAHQMKKAGVPEKDWPMILKACSLAVEGAAAELQTGIQRKNSVHLQKRRDSVLIEINNTYRKINQIERTYASGLKKNLEAERKKALERQEKARQRFNMLQSDLIQVKNDARGIILSMSDILFDIDKATLTPVLKTNLAKIAGILFVYKEAGVIVEGHTDNIGAEDYNQKLSEKRALNVMTFLIEQGIKENRLTAAGYGLMKPVADNSTKEGRQKNRRVDLVISEPKSAK